MSSEASARIVIDRLLLGAGWDIENAAVVTTEEALADGRAAVHSRRVHLIPRNP